MDGWSTWIRFSMVMRSLHSSLCWCLTLHFYTAPTRKQDTSTIIQPGVFHTHAKYSIWMSGWCSCLLVMSPKPQCDKYQKIIAIHVWKLYFSYYIPASNCCCIGFTPNKDQKHRYIHGVSEISSFFHTVQWECKTEAQGFSHA